MSDITVVLGFDMETDIGSWSPYYEGVQRGTPKILDVLDRAGATATFFFTGEAARLHPTVVGSVAKAGHEVGTHSLFHETVGDPLFEIPGVKPLLPEEVPFRLRVATEWVAEALGEQPVSWRCPRLWGSTAVCNVLDALGYVADASYPLYFYGEQLTPYHPSRSDWSQPGDLRLLEIPNFCDMTVECTDEYHRERDQWPLFRTASAAALMEHIDNFSGYVRERGLPVVLCFYFHPWEFEPMPTRLHYGEGAVEPDYFLVENCGDYALQQLGLLVRSLQAQGAEFTTAKALAAAWQ
ncbi:MAG: polysaccharide deacetylase family protein [Armatimonadetes bacterium]|nr:polysaccharide deacetylase family protein [Armatimonadota bacterium]